MITEYLLNSFTKDPSVKRHLLKTVSWRLLGTLDTILLGWLVTGNISTGAQIGGLELFTKMTLYFIHERVWYKTKFGIPTRIEKANRVKKEISGTLFRQHIQIQRHQREELNNNKSYTIWLTGLSGSGKSSIAIELDNFFFNSNIRSYVLDGDNTRLGINNDLSFSKDDRKENIRRVAEICRLFNDAGTITIASFISPFEEDRQMAQKIIGKETFIEIFVDASIETCKDRDTKGLYTLAEQGKIKNFTGVDSPYEKPLNPDIHIKSESASVEECVKQVTDFLIERRAITLKQEIQHT